MTIYVKRVTKDATETRDLTVGWAQFLSVLSGDTIASVAWVVESGLTQGAVSHTQTSATVRLSGGTVDSDYDVTCRITTTGGQVVERTTQVQVREL